MLAMRMRTPIRAPVDDCPPQLSELPYRYEMKQYVAIVTVTLLVALGAIEVALR
jgi:hypothetical protein